MESNFENREFEQYVKRNADQYRMIPSEKVWKSINASLHTRRRWYGFGITLLLLLTAVSVTWVMVSYRVSKKQVVITAQNVLPSVQTHSVKQNQVSAFVPLNVTNTIPLNNLFNQADVPATDKQFTGGVSNNIETNSTFLQITKKDISNPDASLQANKQFIGNITKKMDIIFPSEYTINSNSEEADMLKLEKIILQVKPSAFSGNIPIQNNANHYEIGIERAINISHTKEFSKKLKWQLYFAPTVSYRKLSVNKSYQGVASPYNTVNYPFASSRDVNSEVVHKPDMGLELGVSTKYQLTKNVKLSGGLQFNINRYDIKAFAYSGEQAIINLNGGNGNNSVTAWTNYRNYNGYRSDWLKNFYFSVSAPVGAELRLFGNDKTNIGIAGTVQPTYILKDRAFLISTDYKNYVEIPRLVRHININTSFETFISYKARNANTRWQIGPQIRYQVLSSFQNKYPVKENLFDFGLKIGVSLNH